MDTHRQDGGIIEQALPNIWPFYKLIVSPCLKMQLARLTFCVNCCIRHCSMSQFIVAYQKEQIFSKGKMKVKSKIEITQQTYTKKKRGGIAFTTATGVAMS